MKKNKSLIVRKDQRGWTSFKVQPQRTHQAFTLIELLVVISIIGILIGLSAVSFTTAQKKSRDAKRKADMKEIQTAFEQYYSLNTKYPKNKAEADSTIPGRLPDDPKNSDPYVYKIFYDADSGSGYCACARLEQDVGNVSGLPAEGSFACSFGTSATDQYYCVQNLQ